MDQIAQDSPCGRVHEQGRHSRAGDFRIDAVDAVIGLRSTTQKSINYNKNTLSFALAASTAKLHRRTPLHPRRHERMAEGFHLAFAAPTRCYKERCGGAMNDILLCAAVAVALPITKKNVTRTCCMRVLAFFLFFASIPFVIFTLLVIPRS